MKKFIRHFVSFFLVAVMIVSSNITAFAAKTHRQLDLQSLWISFLPLSRDRRSHLLLLTIMFFLCLQRTRSVRL